MLVLGLRVWVNVINLAENMGNEISNHNTYNRLGFGVGFGLGFGFGLGLGCRSTSRDPGSADCVEIAPRCAEIGPDAPAPSPVLSAGLAGAPPLSHQGGDGTGTVRSSGRSYPGVITSGERASLRPLGRGELDWPRCLPPPLPPPLAGRGGEGAKTWLGLGVGLG